MYTEVSELDQLNVQISNVVATSEELDALRSGLSSLYGQVQDLKVALDGESKQGSRYTIRFVVPGPMVSADECMERLYSIGLVRWKINSQASAKGQPVVFY